MRAGNVNDAGIFEDYGGYSQVATGSTTKSQDVISKFVTLIYRCMSL